MKLLLPLLFAAALTHAGAIFIGLHIGEARSEARVVTLTKTCPAPKPHTAWSCESWERREYLNVCARRAGLR